MHSLSKETKWVHPINEKRESIGEYHHLMSDLKLDDFKFRTYFRLSKDHFEEAFGFIEQGMKRTDTNLRNAISSGERLAICLR